MKRARTEASASRQDDFDLEEFLPFQLSLAANRVARLFARRYADAFGITIPEWRVMAVVGRHEGISPSRVSERTGMDKVKVSRAAASLVARGLVRQTADPGDGRARVLRMTRKGERIYAGMVPLAREIERELQSGLSRTEWGMLERLLGKLGAQLDEISGAEVGPDPG